MKTKAQTTSYYVRIPHQTDPQVFPFDTEAELVRFLERRAPAGAGLTTYTREEWMQYAHNSGEEPGSAWWDRWIKPGLDLFDKGATQIVEVWRNECHRELYPAEEAPSLLELLMEVTDDYHAHFILDEGQARAAVANPERLPQHRRFGVVSLLSEALE